MVNSAFCSSGGGPRDSHIHSSLARAAQEGSCQIVPLPNAALAPCRSAPVLAAVRALA